jgi:hypothetical protein
MTEQRMMSNKQVAVMAAALCLGLGLAPGSAVAAKHAAKHALTVIGDPKTASKARVNPAGGLAVTPRDATTGAEAKVDAGGHALVGDGTGPLTVDGSVSVNGSVTATAPTATWNFTPQYSATYYDVTPPKDVAVNLSALYIGGDNSTAYVYLAVYAATVPSSATTCQASAESSTMIWQGEAHPDGVSVSFPVPLRAVPSAGKKVCLFAFLNKSGGFLVDLNGYYG